jgi:hypothetical protein
MSAQVTITQLPAAGAITGTESVPIVQNGVTVQTTTGAIAASPSQPYTYLTVTQTPQLANSRYFGATNGLTITDGGAQGVFNVTTTGALSSLVASGTGFQVKTSSTAITGRSIAVSGAGLSISNGSGVSGDPTITLAGQVLNLANLSANGLMTITTAGAISATQIAAVGNQTVVTNATGIAGNPTIGLADNPIIPGTGAIQIPAGSTGQRPSGVDGKIRFNSTDGAYEGYATGAWRQFALTGGVLTVSGTANEITATGTANVVLSLPTALTFTGKTVTGGTFNMTAATVGSDTVTTNTATQTLTNKSISGSANTLTNIPNGALTNSSLTIGTTAISLGSSSLTLGGLTSVAVTQDPTTALQLATKQYVDAVAEGLHIHASCDAATTGTLASLTGGTVTYNNGTSGVGATLTLSSPLTVVDGYTLLNGNRLMVKNEVAQANNGIYTWATGGTVLTRATDFDTSAEIASGDYSFVTNGTLYASTGWVQTQPVTTVGTDAIIWQQFSGAGTYTAGTGLTLTGTQFSITNTTVTAGSYGSASSVPNYTVNAQGQLTAAASTAIAINGNQITSGVVGTANGGTGLSSFTANGVVYASSTSALATGSALTFDGTNFTVGVSATTGDYKTFIQKAGGELLGLNASSGTLTRIAFGNTTATFGSTQIIANAADLAFITNSAEQMRLSSSGLEIKQSQLIGYSSYAGIGTNGLAVAGNVGVGTASPAAKVDVSQSQNGQTAVQLTNSNAGASAEATFIANNGTYIGSFGVAGASKSAFGAILASDAYIFSNANVANTGITLMANSANGVIKFATGGSAEKMRLDSAGNLGLGVTPSAWTTNWKAFQFGATSALSDFSNQSSFWNNTVVTGATTPFYQTTAAASFYRQTGGQHLWYNAPSGAANDPITFAQAMTLDASGRLLIGGTTTYDFNGQSNLVVNGTANNSTITIASTTDGYLAFADGTAGTQAYVGRISYYHSLNQMDFWTNGTAKMYLDSAGNLGLGVTPATVYGESSKFTIDATGKTNGIYINFNGTGADKQIFLTNGGNANCFVGTDNIAMTFGTANTERARISSDGTFRVKGAGTAGSTDAFQVAGTAPADAARITSDGYFLIGTTTSASRNITVGTTNASIALAGANGGLYFGAAGTPVGSGGFGVNAAIARAGGANFHITGSVDGDLCIAPEGTKAILFGTSASASSVTESARIDSSGNLLVGTTSSIAGAARLAVLFAGNATDGFHIQDSTTTSGAVFQAFSNSAGTSIGNIARVTTTNAVAYNTTSDYRLKTVTGAVTGQGARIDALKPIDYQWKDGNVPARGFLAHEFQTVYPNSVTGDKDAVDADGNPKHQSMQASTSEVIADLVAELQDLRKRLAAAGI